jgi:hypothetical protein
MSRDEPRGPRFPIPALKTKKGFGLNLLCFFRRSKQVVVSAVF